MAPRVKTKFRLRIEFLRTLKVWNRRHTAFSTVIPVQNGKGIQSSVLVFLAVSEIPSMFPRVIPANREGRREPDSRKVEETWIPACAGMTLMQADFLIEVVRQHTSEKSP